MNRAGLKRLLDAEGVMPSAYRLDGRRPGDECYVLERTYVGWRVYYAERGERVESRRFVRESGACRFMARTVLSDPTTRRVAPMNCICAETDELWDDEAREYELTHLELVDTRLADWEKDFRCPATGARWRETWPHSALHGGGPRRLARLAL